MKKKIILCAVVACGLILFFSFSSGDISTHVDETFAPFSSEHPLGTDNLGRDMYSLLAQGGLRTLKVIVISTLISCGGGTLLGLFAGYYGGVFQTALQFVVDLLMTIPSFVMALIFSALFGFGPISAGIVLGIGNLGMYANQALSLTQSAKSSAFIQAEKVLGIGSLRIIMMHILPHIAQPLLTVAANQAGRVSIQYASLAFIGLGTDVTTPDWGTMLYQYRVYFLTYPSLVLLPAAMIFIVALLFHVVLEPKYEDASGEVSLFE